MEKSFGQPNTAAKINHRRSWRRNIQRDGTLTALDSLGALVELREQDIQCQPGCVCASVFVCVCVCVLTSHLKRFYDSIPRIIVVPDRHSHSQNRSSSQLGRVTWKSSKLIFSHAGSQLLESSLMKTLEWNRYWSLRLPAGFGGAGVQGEPNCGNPEKCGGSRSGEKAKESVLPA